MFKTIFTRLKQKFRTLPFPEKEPQLVDKFQGCPEINVKKCNLCQECCNICPTAAISHDIKIDLGKCIFCQKCTKICPNQTIQFSKDYRLAVNKREDLILSDKQLKKATVLGQAIKKILGRSLCLRQVSAGGCNGCELDINVLSTIVFDLSRFGIQFTASPRHADGLVITGPITCNMKEALLQTYEAISEPKIVIAVGACAISGGIYADHEEVLNGADKLLPVDLFIPGCPPHPITILDGLLRLINKTHTSLNDVE